MEYLPSGFKDVDNPDRFFSSYTGFMVLGQKQSYQRLFSFHSSSRKCVSYRVSVAIVRV
jgi:hypothetical protein